MGYSMLHLLDWLLWIVMAASVLYALFFALASLLPQRRNKQGEGESPSSGDTHFLVLFPAYKEDAVIVHSVETFLRQDYPAEKYHVVVISDHMQPATNERLSALPITLLTPQFEKSSKAKALQYAMAPSNLPQLGEAFPTDPSCAAASPNWGRLEGAGGWLEGTVVLDADNIVSPDFLSKLNALCQQGYKAIQCHRTAKNADNDIAALDGLSEEINNSIFRRGHNRLGLSSALIGSGMCFDYEWFRQNVGQLRSAVEDRELEALLMRQGIYIHFADDILVMDEKVSSSDNFQRQRLRWMTGQVQSLALMLRHLPSAIRHGNINYIDKTLQQTLIPRSLLLVFIPLLAIVTLVASPVHSIKWWVLLALLVVALLVAIPRRLRGRQLLACAAAFPRLAWRMLANLLHINTRSNDFLHTTHGKEAGEA